MKEKKGQNKFWEPWAFFFGGVLVSETWHFLRGGGPFQVFPNLGRRAWEIFYFNKELTKG